MLEERRITFTSGISLRRAEEMLSIYDMKGLAQRLNYENYSTEDLIKIVELASLGNIDAQNALLRIKKIKKEIVEQKIFDTTLFLFERLIDLRKAKKGTKLEEHISQLLADSIYDFLSYSNTYKYDLLLKLVVNCKEELLSQIKKAQSDGKKIEILRNPEILNILFMDENILDNKDWLVCFKKELEKGNFILLKKIISLKHYDESLNVTLQLCFKAYKKDLLTISYAIKQAKIPMPDAEIEKAANLIIGLCYKNNKGYGSISLDQYATILFDRKIFKKWKEKIETFQNKLSRETNKRYRLKLIEAFLSSCGIVNGEKRKELQQKILEEYNNHTVDDLTVWEIIKSSTGEFEYDTENGGGWKLIADRPHKLIEEYYDSETTDKGPVFKGKLADFRKYLVLFYNDKIETEIDQIYSILFSNEKLEDKINKIGHLIKKFIIEQQRKLDNYKLLPAEERGTSPIYSTYLKQKLQFQEIITILISDSESYEVLLKIIFDELKGEAGGYFFPIDGKVASKEFLECFADKIIGMEESERRNFIKKNFVLTQRGIISVFLNDFQNTWELKQKAIPKDVVSKQNDFLIKVIEEAGLENDPELRFVYLKALLENDLIRRNIATSDYRKIGKIFIQKLNSPEEFDNYIKILVYPIITVFCSAIRGGFEKEIKKDENKDLRDKFEKIYQDLVHKKQNEKKPFTEYENKLFIEILIPLFGEKKINQDNANHDFQNAVILYKNNPKRTLEIGQITIDSKEIEVTEQTISYFKAISKFISEKFESFTISPKMQGGDDGFIIDTKPKTYVKFAYIMEDNQHIMEPKIIEYRTAKYISELLGDACIKINIQIIEDGKGVIFYTQAMSENCKDLSEVFLEDLDTEDKKLEFKKSLIFNVVASGIFGLFDNRADNMSVDLDSGKVRIIDFSEYPVESQYQNAIHLNFKDQSLKEAFLEFILDSNNKEEGTLGNDGTLDMIGDLLGDDEESIRKIILEKFKEIKNVIIKDIEKLEELKNEEPKDEKKIEYQEKLLKSAITRYNEASLFFNRHYGIGIESIFKRSIEITTVAIEDSKTKSSDKIKTELQFDRQFSESFTQPNIEKINKLFQTYEFSDYKIEESSQDTKITFTFKNGKKTIIISNGNDIDSEKCRMVELINLAMTRANLTDRHSLEILDLSEDFRNDEKFLTKYELSDEKVIGNRRYIRLQTMNLEPETIFDFTIPADVSVINFITLSRQKGLINTIDELNGKQKKVDIRYYIADESDSEQLRELVMQMNGNFMPNMDRVDLKRVETQEELNPDSLKIPRFQSLTHLLPLPSYTRLN